MGQLNCGGCDCSMADVKAEFDLRGEKDPPEKSSGSRSNREISGIDITRKYAAHVRSVTMVQALWRGRQDRKAVLHLTRAQAGTYFQKQYVLETLRKGRTGSHQVESRPVYVYSDGAQYAGQWLGGFRHGVGIMLWLDGCKYEGGWGYGQPSGMGKFVDADGEMYSGLWKHSKANVRTSLKMDPAKMQQAGRSDGYGESHAAWVAYKEMVKSGAGKRTWQSSKREALERTVEEITKRLHSGAPQLNRVSGRKHMDRLSDRDSTYSGEVLGGQKDGWGRCEWNNGDVYEGEWERDAHSGYGVNKWADGSSYRGFYNEGRKEGIGHYIWQDGSEFLGEWKDNHMHGKGRYQWSDGRSYLGEWIEGLMHGYGIFTWKDGRKYEGGWYQGKKHGEGVTYDLDGKHTRDIWRHGKVVKADV